MENKESKAGKASSFQFVSVTKPGHGWKNENEHIVRSHVMRQLRQKQREERKAKRGEKDGYRVPRSAESAVHDEQNGERRVPAEDPEMPWKASPALKQRTFDGAMPPLRLPPTTNQLTILDKKLLEHISEFYSPLISNISPKFVLWTRGIQELVNIAASFDFLLHAVLAWSATHLAQLTGESEVQQEAYRHRCLALGGLQQAIKSFSKDNSDAVLCTSIVLAWQSCDAKVWASMMRGCQTVKSRMVAWERRSTFHNDAQGYSIGLDSNSMFNREVTMRALSIPGDEIDNIYPLLGQGLESLRKYRDTVLGPPELLEAINQMTTYLEFARVAESFDPPPTRDELLDPLRSMMFWLPVRFIPSLHTGPNVMLIMAHVHAIALLIDPVQDNESAFFRRLNVAPIQSFHEEFAMRAALEVGPGASEGQYRQALDLMDFPLNAVAAFERRLLRFDCSDTQHIRVGEIKSGIGWVNYDDCLSTIKILENFPVGLWHNSMS